MTKRRYNRKTKRKTKRAKSTSLANITFSSAKKLNVWRVRQSLSTHIYTFVRTTDNAVWESSNVSDIAYNKSFTLSDVLNSSEYTNLFDSYRIVKVQMTFDPLVNNVSVQQGSTGSQAFECPDVYFSTDDDDISTPSKSELLQRPGVIIKPATKKCVMNLVPQVSREIYRGLAQTAYEIPNKLIWLDAAYADVPHFGFKGLIEATGASTDAVKFGYNINVKYVLQFRRPR